MVKKSNNPGKSKGKTHTGLRKQTGYDEEKKLSGEEMQVLKRKKSSGDDLDDEFELSKSKKMPATKDDLWDDPSIYEDDVASEEEYW